MNSNIKSEKFRKLSITALVTGILVPILGMAYISMPPYVFFTLNSISDGEY